MGVTMKALLALLFCALVSHSPTAQAKSFAYLATVYSDSDPRIADLYLLQGERKEALGIRSIDRASKVADDFSTSKLPAGIVLMKVQGREVFILRSQNFDANRGGSIELDYLKNGMTGNRDQVEIEVEYGPSGWQALHEGKPFRFIKVVSKRFLGKVVGIKELEFRP